MPRSVNARFGASLNRAPYVWFATTILAYLVIVSSVASEAQGAKHASPVMAVTTTVFIAYSCVAWTLLPRFVFGRARKPVTVEQTAAIRWALAMSPFLYGLVSGTAGGPQWSLALGMVVSIVLLVLAVKAIRRLSPGV